MKPMDSSYFANEVCQPFLFQGGPCGILLIHGFTGSVAHMRPLGEMLHACGYSVMGINLSGHAQTENAMALSDWKQWLRDAKQAVKALRELCSTVVVGGLSMGGVIALILAAEGVVDACIPISAPLGVKNKLMPLAKWVAPLYPRISWRSQQARHEMLNQQYDYGYSGFPTRKAVDLQCLISMAKRTLSQVACPVLCVQSYKDETVWEGSAEAIVRGIGSLNKRVLWLKEAPHVCTLSAELPDIVTAIDNFLIESLDEVIAKNSAK